MNDKDEKPVVGCDGTCGIHKCPFFHSSVESAWGIAWKCMRGGINAVPGFPSNIPSRTTVCPHEPLAPILNKMSKLSCEDKIELSERLEELMDP